MSLARGATAAGLVALFSAAMTGGALAEPPVRESIDDAFTDVVTDFCGEPGLTVDVEGTVTGRLQITRHGRDGLAYFAEHLVVELTLSTPDGAVTEVDRVLNKDLHVVATDGNTLTIETLSTGNATLYGPDGKAIARNPGQVRFVFVVDDNGTPADPDDDTEISQVQTKGSTGRSDDFCDAAVPVLQG
ncbi:hypothetical protein [Geodermatophilus sp. FMUSA9-8]|uniref:hypothetical protein n=1 Tax=Geodermatophilus sp. FMUSA9-8 TaxID=3120155 RepID=UPI00300A02F4